MIQREQIRASETQSVYYIGQCYSFLSLEDTFSVDGIFRESTVYIIIFALRVRNISVLQFFLRLFVNKSHSLELGRYAILHERFGENEWIESQLGQQRNNGNLEAKEDPGKRKNIAKVWELKTRRVQELGTQLQKVV